MEAWPPNNSDGTCLEAVNWEGALGKEILVAEHVDLVHDKAQKGKRRVAHSEAEGLARPGGVKAIVGWWKEWRNTFSLTLIQYSDSQRWK